MKIRKVCLYNLLLLFYDIFKVLVTVNFLKKNWNKVKIKEIYWIQMQSYPRRCI